QGVLDVHRTAGNHLQGSPDKEKDEAGPVGPHAVLGAGVQKLDAAVLGEGELVAEDVVVHPGHHCPLRFGYHGRNFTHQGARWDFQRPLSHCHHNLLAHNNYLPILFVREKFLNRELVMIIPAAMAPAKKSVVTNKTTPWV